ncbi:MAG: hypothetical protein JST21_18065 [Bacteroidetes bacterium]|nr:hypothetical protein [Bacteroidota bacterium]
MDSPVENIVQHLFQTDSLDTVSTEQLEQLVNDHPYFDAAYFLLAKKLYQTQEPDYEKALRQAALHFSNEMWFRFMLNEKTNQTEKNQTAKASETIISKEEATAASIDEIAQDVHSEDSIASTEIISDTEPAAIHTEDEDGEIDSVDENYNEADFPVNEKLSSILKEQAAALDKPVEANAELPLETTPYHRVDYFDSQGIKLEEDKANDKLGTQLRRFTDWLKQMKKNGSTPASLNNDVEGEIKVQHMAETSNEQQETVTETMAEVLAKQGKPEQAIEIYEKLSFINPSKSAYFAAKIEELKV